MRSLSRIHAGVRDGTHGNARWRALAPYTAGLFEGEGHVGIYRSKERSGRSSYCLTVVLNLTDREPLDLLHERWGGAIHALSADPRKHRKPLFRWVTSARTAASFLSDVQPYLLMERRKSAVRVALEFQAQKRNMGRGTTEEYRRAQAVYAARIRSTSPAETTGASGASS